MEADTPINLANLNTMSNAEHEALLTNIRERRLAPVKAYEEMTLLKAQAYREKCEDQYEKQMGIFAKRLASTDKAMINLEKTYNKLRALRLEIEG